MVIIRSPGAIDQTDVTSWFQQRTAIKQKLLEEAESLVASSSISREHLSFILEATEMLKKEKTLLYLLQKMLEKGVINKEQLALLKELFVKENDALSNMINEIVRRAKEREPFAAGMERIVIHARALIDIHAKLLAMK